MYLPRYMNPTQLTIAIAQMSTRYFKRIPNIILLLLLTAIDVLYVFTNVRKNGSTKLSSFIITLDVAIFFAAIRNLRMLRISVSQSYLQYREIKFLRFDNI